MSDCGCYAVTYDPVERRFIYTPIGGGEGGGPAAWADITGKPSTFPPEAHAHIIGDITSLQAALDAKAATSHNHDAAYAPIGIKLDDLTAPDDNTDLDASTTKHGLMKKFPGGTTNFLRADGSFAAPPGGGGGISVLDREVTLVDIVNTTETALFSHTIPGGTLTATGILRLSILADIVTTGSTSLTITLRVKLGGTTIFQDVTAALAVSSNRRPIPITILIAAQNATNVQRMNGTFVQATNATPTTGYGDLGAAGAAYAFGSDSAIDMTADRVLEVTAQLGGTVGSASLKRQAAILELL